MGAVARTGRSSGAVADASRDLRSHLSRLRARYRVLLREEVTRTVAKAEDVDEELYQLCTVLSEAY